MKRIQRLLAVVLSASILNVSAIHSAQAALVPTEEAARLATVSARDLGFITLDDIIQTTEGMIRKLFEDTIGVELPNPLPRMSYGQAMEEYGNDRPDTLGYLHARDDEAMRVEHAVIRCGPILA